MRYIARPKPGDYPDYAELYMKLLPVETDILAHLEKSFLEVKEFIYALPPGKLLYRYKEDKWSIKEILVHLVDDERIYAYRALRFARNEKVDLPGFDQDIFAFYSEADNRELENIFSEYEAVRRSTIALFEGIPEDSLDRMGRADNKNTTVRSLAWHIAGHELHHIRFIRENYI